MITDPLTQDLGQIKARALLLGYQQHGNQGLYGEAFAFNGDANIAPDNNTINDAGGNIGYAYNGTGWNFDLGGSYIADLADSIFMNDTGAPTTLQNGNPAFGGFSVANGNFSLVNRVPAYDLHGSLGVGDRG